MRGPSGVEPASKKETRRLSGVVLDSLDDGVTTGDLARQASRSRTQFHRRFRFHSPGSRSKGEFEMELFQRFAGNDSWHTRKLLEAASTLTDEQLDRPLETAMEILPWREKTQTLRQLLENIVYTKEVWAAALKGGRTAIEPTPKFGRTPAAMLARLEKTDQDLEGIFGEVGARGTWDDTFVDALCEPAETFTFGGVFAHIMTFNGHRRLLALDALKRAGVDIQGFGDPMEYEQAVQPWKALDDETARK